MMKDARKAGLTWPEMLVVCLIITVAGMIVSSAIMRSAQMVELAPPDPPDSSARPLMPPPADTGLVATANTTPHASPLPASPPSPPPAPAPTTVAAQPERSAPGLNADEAADSVTAQPPEKQEEQIDPGLEAAIRTDLPQVLTMLVGGGVDVNQPDNDGLTPLGLAARLGRLECTRILLAAGADPSGGADAGHAPTIEATANNRVYVATMLLNAGADTSVRTAQGLTLLHLAAEKGSLPLVKLFVRQGLNVNDAIPGQYRLYKHRTPLDFALGSGDLDTVSLLVTSGARKGETPPAEE